MLFRVHTIMTIILLVSVHASICNGFYPAENENASTAPKMGEEQFGNKPLNTANYTDWPGVGNVVNDRHRVYHQWVNGSELLCYRGDTDALNDLLANLSEVESDTLEVVLLPGSAEQQTFETDVTVSYDWKLSLVGGIAAAMAERDKGENIWARHPILTIRVTENVDLESIRIPDNIELLQTSDLKVRFSECLSSEDQNVRGWCCAHLAKLDAYDTEVMHDLATLLDDESSWVRLNAVISIATYGRAAKDLLPRIKSCGDGVDDEQLTKRIADTVATIEKAIDADAEEAKANAAAEKAQAEYMDVIQRFCESRNE